MDGASQDGGGPGGFGSGGGGGGEGDWQTVKAKTNGKKIVYGKR